MRQLIDFNFSTERNMAPDEQRRLQVNIVEILHDVIEEIHSFDYDENISQNDLDFTVTVIGEVNEELKNDYEYDRRAFLYKIRRLALPIQEDSVKIVFRNII